MNDTRVIVYAIESTLNPTPTQIERWAAQRGYLVTNTRPAPPHCRILYQGHPIAATPGLDLWLADIITTDHDEDTP